MSVGCFLEQHEETIIAKATTILKKASGRLTENNFGLETSHTIAVPRPVASEMRARFVSLSPAYRVTIPTTYLFLLLSRAAADISRGKSKNFFRMLRNGEETRSLAGICFESYVKARISACKDEKVSCKPLCAGSGPGLDSFSFTLRKGVISFTDDKDLLNILTTRSETEIANILFAPVQRNFPTLDFLFFQHIPADQDRNAAIQANLLQVTVSPSHSAKAIGIVRVANAIPKKFQDFSRYPPRLITLVPEVKDFRTCPQDIERPIKSSRDAPLVKAAEFWLANVPQFVASCPAWATAWGRTASVGEISGSGALDAEFYKNKAEKLEEINKELREERRKWLKERDDFKKEVGDLEKSIEILGAGKGKKRKYPEESDPQNKPKRSRERLMRRKDLGEEEVTSDD